MKYIVPDECYKEYGNDLGGCSRQDSMSCKGCICLIEVEQPKQDNKFNYWRNICEIQAEQTAKGLSKYSYPLEQNTWLDINERLRYLQEELVDVLMYIEHIKTLLGGENETNKR
jgi:hypothetical protein